MSQDTAIIRFPETGVAASSRPCEAPAGDTAAIVDLAGHRRAINARAEAKLVAEATRELGPDEIWDALNDDRLVMHYQPQYDMRTGHTVAAEALVRFVDRNGQLIGPNRFIEAVEQSDLIVLLGRAVIERVCSDLAWLRTDGNDVGRVAINLSARQLNIDTTLPDFVDQMVDHYGLKNGDLEFELTERQGLGPQCAGLAVLHALAHRGARIVIDDFGIGYSSIAYLAELPVSAFKLDRSLISRLPDDKTMQTVVKSLLSLASRLNLDVIAEGIETAVQNDYLVHAGCPYAQGFAHARPMDIADLRGFMSRRSSAADRRCPGLVDTLNVRLDLPRSI